MSEPNKLIAGWGFPLNARRAHYYPAGELRSLCGTSMYGGSREDSNHDSADNCAQCRKRRARLVSPLKSTTFQCGTTKTKGEQA